MAIFKGSTGLQQNWPWWRLILTGLNAFALVLSVILSWHALKGVSMAGCGAGSPCEQVLDSQWSRIAGILPLSALAVGVYLAMLVAGFFTGPANEASIRRLAWSLMLLLAGSITGSAIWLIIVQKWFIGDFCPYCMTAHITGLLLAALVIWRAVKENIAHPDEHPQEHQATVNGVSPAAARRLFRPLRVTGLSLTGLVLAGCMAVCQAAFIPKPVYYGGESQNDLPAIDYRSVPIVGSPDAPYVVTLLFDYQCPHCQKIHFMLDEVIRRYAGKLAFVLCPTPLSAQCNPYIPNNVHTYDSSCELAQTGLAVWIADRETFPAFENWMYTFESGSSWQPRSIEAARAKAVELVGEAKFIAAWSDPWIGRYMKTCMGIFGRTIRNGQGGIPRLVFGQHWVIPEPKNAADLVMILHTSLSVPAP